MIKVQKKVIVSFLVSIITLLAFQSDTFAAQDTYKVETNHLNVRSEANPYSSIRTAIKNKEEVHKLKEFLYAGSKWFYVKTDSGIRGWVNSDYLEENPQANDTTDKYNITLVPISHFLNIREEPNGKVLKVVSNEDVLEFKHQTKKFKGTDWYKVESNGVTGWVKSTYTEEHSRKLKEALRENGEPFQPSHIYYEEFEIPYKNGGKSSGLNLIQSGIYASTWGGTPVFDGEDGKNTHFIGSSKLFVNLSAVKKIIVTDDEGVPYQYIVGKLYYVDATGNGEDGENHWERITGEEGGERIVIQTSIDKDTKLIVEAFYLNTISAK